MVTRFIQANVNMSKPSLDLLLHYAKETETGILLISEPNYIPDTSNWFASKNSKAAIFVDPNHARSNCEIAKIGSCFVAIYYGQFLLISIYAPPNLDLRWFNNTLDELSEAISHRVNKVIIGGDFNAKACLWGSNVTDKRGLLLTRWAAERDFRIANLREKPTCIRPQRCSIIDLTWTSPDLTRFIRDWRVEDEAESLSDHLYVSFSLCFENSSTSLRRPLQRIWSCKRFDVDLFIACLAWRGYGPTQHTLGNINHMVKWIDQVLTEACDTAADRIGARKPRRVAYGTAVTPSHPSGGDGRGTLLVPLS